MFYDFASIKVGEPSYVRIRGYGGELIVCKAVCDSLWVSMPSGEAFPEFDIHFCAVPDDRGVLLERIRQDAED